MLFYCLLLGQALKKLGICRRAVNGEENKNMIEKLNLQLFAADDAQKTKDNIDKFKAV